MPQLKLVIEESSEGARMYFEPDFTMRSSINMPMESPNQLLDFGGAGQKPTNSNFFFEEVKSNNQSKEVNLMTESQMNFVNTGCGDDLVMTEEKEMSARVDTNEMGSQIQKDVKEVCCDGSI